VVFMKKFSLFLVVIIFISLKITGQNDRQAIAILDRFSAAATSAPSVSMKFLIISDDQVENTRDSITGSVIISKNSYKLDLPENIIWFNGETSWSYLPAEQEVTITKPDKKDDSFQSRPSSIFTMYKKGYKNRLVEEKSDSYIIDLYPEDIKNELIRVRLTLAKPSLILKNFEYKRRDGTDINIIVKDYNLKKVPEPGMFVFSPDKYKGVEIIDMR
jgi:outer membrane lipoprotein carrier protein